jgi:hypothetical protein
MSIRSKIGPLFAFLLLTSVAHADGFTNTIAATNDGFGGISALSGTGSGGFPGNVVAGAKAWWGLRAYTTATAGTKSANVCNAGDANCADVNTLANGNFDVTTAQGAPLNCGGAGGTCTIKTLYDKSGSLACTGGVACDVTNVTAAARPTLVFNCTGTLPCMAFSGAASQQLVSAVLTATIAQPNTASFVSQRTSGVVLAGVIGPTGTVFGYGTANLVDMSGGTPVTAAATDATLHAVQAVLNGASSAFDVDSVLTGPLNAGATGTSGIINMGSTGAANFLTGQIMEVGLWPVAFSPIQQANMNTNQHNYWFPVGVTPSSVVAAILGGFL